MTSSSEKNNNCRRTSLSEDVIGFLVSLTKAPLAFVSETDKQKSVAALTNLRRRRRCRRRALDDTLNQVLRASIVYILEPRTLPAFNPGSTTPDFKPD